MNQAAGDVLWAANSRWEEQNNTWKLLCISDAEQPAGHTPCFRWGLAMLMFAVHVQRSLTCLGLPWECLYLIFSSFMGTVMYCVIR